MVSILVQSALVGIGGAEGSGGVVVDVGETLLVEGLLPRAI